jgi:hypothetical protein
MTPRLIWQANVQYRVDLSTICAVSAPGTITRAAISHSNNYTTPWSKVRL